MSKSRAKPRKNKEWKEREYKEKKLIAGSLYTAKDAKLGLQGKSFGTLVTAEDKKGFPLGEMMTAKDKDRGLL